MKQTARVYIEALTLPALFVLGTQGWWRNECFYVMVTPLAQKWAGKLHELGMIKYLPQEFTFSYADLRDNKGYHLFESINQDLITLSSKVSDGIAPDFYKDLNDICDQRRLNLFFLKVVADRMHNTLIFLRALHLREKEPVWCVLPASAWAKTFKKNRLSRR